MTPKTLDKYIAKVKKQYAEEGWSLIEYQNELYKMQGEMSDQYSDGKITDEEYQKVIQKIQNALSKPGLQGKKAEPAASDANKQEKPKKISKAGAILDPAYKSKPAMTDDEYMSIWSKIDKMNMVGDITDAQAQYLSDELDKMKKSGKSFADASDKIDAELKEAKADLAKAKAVNTPSKGKGYSDLYDWLVDISDEEIDGLDAMALTDMVEYLKKSNVDPADAKKQLESAVNMIKNQFTAEEAMFTVAGYKPGMQPVVSKPAPLTDNDIGNILKQVSDYVILNNLEFEDYNNAMNALYEMKKQGKSLVEAQQVLTDLKQKQKPPAMTQDEYKSLLDDLKKKNKVGLITQEELKTLGDTLDSLYNSKISTYADVQKMLGLDPGSMATVDAVDNLGKECKKVYKQAAEEMQAKLDEWTARFQNQLAENQAKVAAGEMTQTEFAAWLKRQKEMSKILEDKIEQATGMMLHANEKAIAMVNGKQLNVFAENANYQSYELVQDTKVNLMFSIYDEDTAAKLLKEKPELLPPKVVNGQKDKAWNQKIIANTVLQAVIQGESIPSLAKRVAVQTGETNMKAMLRYARTAMTAAQNCGRMEMLHRAKGMGIGVKKRWLATLDSRTRDVHRNLDGQTVDVDEPFQSDLGKIMFPGDPAAAPGNVYNCRCTLVYEYEGFPNDPTDNMRRDNETGQLITDMNYDEWKAAKEGSKLNDLNLAKIHLAEVQKDCLKKRVSETKVYKDLWKEDVTLADYPDKKDSIAAKRDYYTAEIEKFNQAKAEGKSWATDEKIDALVKKRKLLDEFEKHGELLVERNKALKEVQDIYDQVGLKKTAQANVAKAAAIKKKAKEETAAPEPAKIDLNSTGGKKTQFAPDAWDAKTKKAAKMFTRRTEADKDLRPELDAEWDSLTDAEKYACWEYTRNSNPMNKSLSGYHDRWDRSSFLGYANTQWGHEDSWRSLPRQFQEFGTNGHATYYKAITDLTNAIEKTVFKKDRWLVRGSDNNGFAGMLEGAGMDFNQMKRLLDRGDISAMKQALVGKKAINHAFTSTGIANDAGFSGEVKYSIYAPKGTKAIYAEPQSHYGHSMGGSDKIYKKGSAYSDVGHEAEVIIQRGTTFVIRDIKENSYGIEVEMEIVEQPDYFVNGDEDTYNGGKTRHMR